MKENAKPRVLIVAPGPPMVGGQAVQARRLLEKFKNEEDVEIAFLPINPEFLPALQKIKYLRTFLTTIRYLISLVANIRKFDVIHVFSASFTSFILAPLPAILVAKAFGRPVILNYRSGYAEKHLGRSAVTRWAFGLCDRIVTPSGFLVDVFARFGFTAESVFNFVDAEKFESIERKEIRPRFLSNRNFEDLYNVECTIRAFSLIQKEFPEASIVIAGDGPLNKGLRQIAADLAVRNIEFVGSISQDDMVSHYSNADFYLNSPNIDNMPNSVIEAFAAGAVVISTNAGGIPYIVENGVNGVLVEIGDCEKLAAEAIRLLKSPETCFEIIKRARKDVMKYSWQSVKEDWKDLYLELAGFKRSSPPETPALSD